MALNIKFENHERALKAFHANKSLRYCRLDYLEQWERGTQYQDRQGWWDDTDDVPLWERAPCVVYPVVAIAARSNVDLCLGQGRFPVFSTKQDEDEEIEENGLSEDDSATLDRFIREYHRISRFKAHARGAFYSAQSVGSVAGLYGFRNGRPFNELVPAKWCEPKFDEEGNVTFIRIQYPYVEEVKKPDGKWEKVARVYRREIDTENDTEYHPLEADESGRELTNWVVNKDRSREHGLGFCPVIWYPLMKGATTVNVIDGEPIHRGITDEIEAHDIARSQWHRGALLSEPQLCEFGVPRGYNPTELGRLPLITSTEHGGAADLTPDPETGKPKNPVTGSYVDAGARSSKKARKKGPGFVWQYENKDSKVETLIYPEGALKAQENNVRDLRIKLQEALSVVFLDPESIKFAATTSGKALQAIKQKQIDRCDQYRDDLAENFLEPSVSMQLRIAQRLMNSGKGLRVPGAKKVRTILDKFIAASDKFGGQWQSPTLRVQWGPYFKADPEEQRKIIDLVKAALSSKDSMPVATLRMAVQKIADAGVFPIENVQAIVDEILDDAKKAKPANDGEKKPGEPEDEESDAEDDPEFDEDDQAA